MHTISEFLRSLQPTEVIELNRGDFLFKQNDSARGIFLVNDGRIKLIRDSIDGNEVILHVAQSNDSLAEASLFSNHYHCHAKSDIQSEIFFYAKDKILNILSSNTTSAFNFIEALARQIQKLRLLLELRGIRSPEKRFMQYLQLNADADKSIEITSTYKDLAITLGMTHETLYRLLGKLEKNKVLERREKLILLI